MRPTRLQRCDPTAQHSTEDDSHQHKVDTNKTNRSEKEFRNEIQNTTFRAKQHFLLRIDVTYFIKGGLNASEASYHFCSLSKSIMGDKKTSPEDDKLGNLVETEH